MSNATSQSLRAKFTEDSLVSSELDKDNTVVAIAKKQSVVEIATYLKNELGFNFPCYCTCIDNLTRKEGPRFEMVYQLRALERGETLRLKIELEESDLKMDTLSTVWPAFNWLEREAFDMYGVEFDKHPDLRRIYLYDEFKGYPLRKDYPKTKRQPLARREWGNE